MSSAAHEEHIQKLQHLCHSKGVPFVAVLEESESRCQGWVTGSIRQISEIAFDFLFSRLGISAISPGPFEPLMHFLEPFCDAPAPPQTADAADLQQIADLLAAASDEAKKAGIPHVMVVRPKGMSAVRTSGSWNSQALCILHPLAAAISEDPVFASDIEVGCRVLDMAFHAAIGRAEPKNARAAAADVLEAVAEKCWNHDLPFCGIVLGAGHPYIASAGTPLQIMECMLTPAGASKADADMFRTVLGEQLPDLYDWQEPDTFQAAGNTELEDEIRHDLTRMTDLCTTAGIVLWASVGPEPIFTCGTDRSASATEECIEQILGRCANESGVPASDLRAAWQAAAARISRTR